MLLATAYYIIDVSDHESCFHIETFIPHHSQWASISTLNFIVSCIDSGLKVLQHSKISSYTDICTVLQIHIPTLCSSRPIKKKKVK